MLVSRRYLTDYSRILRPAVSSRTFPNSSSGSSSRSAKSMLVLSQPGAPEPQLVPDRCGNRDFAFVFPQTSNNINVRFRPQWSRDNVGVEKVSHRLQPNIASGSLFAHISKQFVGVEFKVRKVNVGSEFPIRYGKAAPN